MKILENFVKNIRDGKRVSLKSYDRLLTSSLSDDIKEKILRVRNIQYGGNPLITFGFDNCGNCSRGFQWGKPMIKIENNGEIIKAKANEKELEELGKICPISSEKYNVRGQGTFAEMIKGPFNPDIVKVYKTNISEDAINLIADN